LQAESERKADIKVEENSDQKFENHSMKQEQLRKETHIYAHEWKKVDDTATALRDILDAVKRNNIDKMVAKAAGLDIENIHQAKKCVDQVFEKVVSKPVFFDLYAKICQKICESNESFEKMLVIASQEFVERTEVYRSNAEVVIIVRFIEHLAGLLDVDITLHCVNSLLQCGDKVALILLCKLLGKHGKRLKFNYGCELIDGVFAKLKAIVENKHKQASPKARLAFQRVTTLKMNDWE
jgi:MIF4G domain